MSLACERVSYRVLMVCAEYQPLLKVGGLADVAAALPRALAARGHEVAVLLPRIHGMPAGRVAARLRGLGLLRELPSSDGVRLWLLDTPTFRARRRLYSQPDGTPYADDASAFAALAHAAVEIAAGRAGLDWRPDVVHGHDWHAGLLPVLMMLARVPAACVFTIHNLMHQGLFEPEVAHGLGLPSWLLHPDALEFWGRWSFMKGGIMFADQVTTVSPRYAREVLTPAFGEGLEGALQSRGPDLTGVLNGLDDAAWDPAADPFLEHHFSAARLEGKQRMRRAVLRDWSLDTDVGADDAALVAWIGRLTAQKGVDLLLQALPQMCRRPLRLAVLGGGEAVHEQALTDAAARHAGRMSVRIGFDEAEAHRLYAAADIFLMPSRFEPCGLAQMSAMRYGALPVVHAVGGLADTVEDIAAHGQEGTGFCFGQPRVDAMVDALDRALVLRQERTAWQQRVKAAMHRRFGWSVAARAYERVYQRARASTRHACAGLNDARQRAA